MVYLAAQVHSGTFYLLGIGNNLFRQPFHFHGQGTEIAALLPESGALDAGGSMPRRLTILLNSCSEATREETLSPCFSICSISRDMREEHSPILSPFKTSVSLTTVSWQEVHFCLTSCMAWPRLKKSSSLSLSALAAFSPTCGQIGKMLVHKTFYFLG